MKKLSNREIKNIELQILLRFDEFCKKNKLRYYLAGGTLLGAIRHKGFIPWDDDIDVCMPRPDFMKLLQIWIDDNEYCIKSYFLNNIPFPFAKIVNLNTQIDRLYGNEDKNIWIDIVPVDGLPEDIKEVKKIYRICNIYRKLLVLNYAKLGEGKTLLKKYMKYILKPIAVIYGEKRLIDKINKLALKYPYETSKYVGIITWGLYGSGERMLKSEFEKYAEAEFEGYKFPIYSCWNSYLQNVYGNYMELPPEEKRKTHDMTVYYLEDK